MNRRAAKWASRSRDVSLSRCRQRLALLMASAVAESSSLSALALQRRWPYRLSAGRTERLEVLNVCFTVAQLAVRAVTVQLGCWPCAKSKRESDAGRWSPKTKGRQDPETHALQHVDCRQV